MIEILLNTVSVHIDIEVKLFSERIIHQLLAKLLGMPYCRVQNLGRSDPFTIEITCSQRATVVSSNYTINIQHRNHIELELLPQELCNISLLLV